MKKYIIVFAFVFLLLFPCVKGITAYAEPTDGTSTSEPGEEDPGEGEGEGEPGEGEPGEEDPGEGEGTGEGEGEGEDDPSEDNPPPEYIMKPPPDAKTQLDEEDDLLSTKKTLETLQNAVNAVWSFVGINIKSFSYLPGASKGSYIHTTFDIMDTADKYSIYFKPFAYSLCLLFIGISLFSTTVKFEIMTFKGGAKIVGQILFAKIWVDLSYKICMWIIQINDAFVTKIINDTILDAFLLPPPETSTSNIWIIGPIIDVLCSIITLIPIIILGLIMLITGSIISIKLMIRMIELTVMVTLSPPFFACLSGGESTIRYFRNFIATFVSIVLETLFMAVVFCIGMKWWSIEQNENTADFYLTILPNIGLAIVMCVLMVKPPRFLKNLVN